MHGNSNINVIMLLVWGLGFGSHRRRDGFLRHLAFYSVVFPLEEIGLSLKLVTHVHQVSDHSSQARHRVFKTVLSWALRYTVPHLLEALRNKPEGCGFDSRWCHNPSSRTMDHGLTQPLKRNEYQEYFLGGKGGQCVGLTVPPWCAECLEMWEP